MSGNFIGTDKPSPYLGNGIDGITIAKGTQSNTIGGSTALANAIRFNNRNGVSVSDNATTGNTIRFNSIAQPELGIDLGGDGQAQQLRKLPDHHVGGYGTTTTVGISFVSLPNGTYTIDFYAVPSAMAKATAISARSR